MMQPATGIIGSDGTYKLTSEAAAGAIVGEHKVLVIAVAGDKPPEALDVPKTNDAPSVSKANSAVQFKSAVPKKYSDLTGTPLIKKVGPGDNTIDLDLVD